MSGLKYSILLFYQAIRLYGLVTASESHFFCKKETFSTQNLFQTSSHFKGALNVFSKISDGAFVAKTTKGTKHSRLDRVSFVEDSL